MRRGEVRWYRFQAPDKQRPVVILTRESAISFLGEITVAPITTTIRDIPTEVMLRGGEEMPQDCAINLDHLQTVPKGKIGALVATLSREKLQLVEDALMFALGFQRGFGR